MSSFFDKTIEHEIDTANDHLPSERVSLIHLLESGILEFRTRGGESSAFRREEIDLIAGNVPTHLHIEIRLPIVILRRMDLGHGMYSVAGNKVELYLVNNIIVGEVDLQWDAIRDWKPIEHLARPQVQILRKRLPSTTVIGFTLSTGSKEQRSV